MVNIDHIHKSILTSITMAVTKNLAFGYQRNSKSTQHSLKIVQAQHMLKHLEQAMSTSVQTEPITANPWRAVLMPCSTLASSFLLIRVKLPYSTCSPSEGTEKAEHQKLGQVQSSFIKWMRSCYSSARIFQRDWGSL